MAKEIICLVCPNGCRLQCEEQTDRSVVVTGGKCPRGEAYGREELLSPKRVVTAVVASTSDENPRIPIKTDMPILKKYIFPLLKDLAKIQVSVPIHSGDVLLSNYADTGVNVIATRTVLQ